MSLMDRQLNVPLLHLRGEADPYVLADPVDRSRRYARNGRFETVPEAGHYAHEEAPATVNGRLQHFLDGLP
jgi:pimeloyl-ACP methyl ester carboxylesterase